MTSAILPSMKKHLRQSFSDKFLQTQGIITKWLQEYPLAAQGIGFSGGKDSTVILFLIKNVCEYLEMDFNEIRIFFGNTGVEYSQTVRFVHETMADLHHPNFIVLTPKKNFWECIKHDGHYPRGKSVRGKDTDTCCNWLKERPMKHAIKDYKLSVLYDGITALESRNRMIRGAIDGTCHFVQKWRVNKVHPILYWSEHEVWDFIRRQNITTNLIYSLGAKRCGCMTCTAHKGWQDELSKINPKMLRKILRDMGQEQLP